MVVQIRGGAYTIDDTITLEQVDSGTTYRAYNGENVFLRGGQKVENDKITKVTDQTVLERVIDAHAREKLMQIDLSDFVLGAIPDYFGQGIGGYRPPEI